jgi:MOSC domain-containing protein YiiM
LGVVERIFLRPSSRTPVREIERTRAVAGAGLEGDHAGGGNRQVTLIEAEAWQAACRELGRDDLSPAGRRANLVVSGVSLAESIGKTLRAGECLIDVVGETRPCRLMEDYAPGLQQALGPETRGGVYGRVVRSGEIRIGAQVALAIPSGKLEQRHLPFTETAKR